MTFREALDVIMVGCYKDALCNNEEERSILCIVQYRGRLCVANFWTAVISISVRRKHVYIKETLYTLSYIKYRKLDRKRKESYDGVV